MVSENARRLREEKRLTLDEAARLTGVSRSMLAQIEKGDVNPTISMVWKIDHCPGLPAHRARRRDIGHLAGGVAFQVSIVDCIDLSGLCFHTCASP